ncbi:MAG: ABC transporter permease [Alistipes sp.]|nr:ABC transporter permease [Alistipes sp.]
MKLQYAIAARYVRSPKSHSVINIISGVSMVAMAIPVAAIILLLSIFNGLESMTYDLYRAINADLKITPSQGTTIALERLDTTALGQVPGVEAYTLVLEQSALAEADGRQTIVSLKGVDSNFSRVIAIKEKLYWGTFTTSLDDKECIVVAHGAAHDLGLLSQSSLGEHISLYAINRKRFSSLLPVGGYSRSDMPMTGIFAIDQDNSHQLYTSLRAAQRLFNYPDRISSVELKLQSGADADAVSKQLQRVCGEEFSVKTRFQSNSIYRLMALEKWGVFFIAMVVMAVASLSIVGTLVMVIIDKRDDIETLRTLGASHPLIERIFLGEGNLMALISLTIGVVLGVVLALVQQHFGLIRLNTVTLMVDAYPIELQLVDVLLTIVVYAIIAWGIIRLTVRKTLKQTVKSSFNETNI